MAPHKGPSSEAFVRDVSLFFEPAYLDSCFGDEHALSKCFHQGDWRAKEPRKIALEPTYLPSFANAKPALRNISEAPYSSGEMMQAAAAMQLSYLTFEAPPGLECNGYNHSTKKVQNQKDEHKHRRIDRRRRSGALLIATQLNELQEEDAEKIIIARKINRLGFDSARILKAHFGQVGRVAKVLLSNTHSKQPGDPRQIRLRPSGIAFVVFEDADAAAQVLAKGEVHRICGLEVWVRAFERRQLDDDPIEDPIEQDVEETSSIATASTRLSHSSVASGSADPDYQ